MMKRIVVLTLALVVLGVVVGATGTAMATTGPTAEAGDDVLFDEQSSEGEVLYQTTDTNETVDDDEVNETTEPAEANETADGAEANETDETNETEDTNETGVSPGARLAGVIGVQAAEIDGAVSERAFGLSVAAAVSNGSKARVISNQTAHMEARLAELRNESAELEAADDNGSIRNGTYHAQAATLSARINALEGMVNRTIEESERLPPAVRAAHGVNRTRLSQLHAATGNATGQEIAAIARTIAGPHAGRMAGERGPPAHAGPMMGPPTNQTPGNVSQGPPANRTMGPANDSRMGPPENVPTGPQQNESAGPDSGSQMGPDNRTRGPPSDRTSGSSPGNSGGQGGPPAQAGSTNSP